MPVFIITETILDYFVRMEVLSSYIIEKKLKILETYVEFIRFGVILRGYINKEVLFSR